MSEVTIVGRPKIELFFNKTNNYRILKIIVDEPCSDNTTKIEEGEIFTVVGIIPNLVMGMKYEFTGNLDTHSKYGKQLVVSNMKKVEFDSKKAVVIFLSSPIFAGIGEKTAERIVDKLGDNAIDRILKNKNILLMVPRINYEKASEIHKILFENFANEQISYELVKAGLNISQANEFIKNYGEKALIVFKQNPYIALEVLEKASFNEIDTIALNNGVEKDDVRRIEAGVETILVEEAFKMGHEFTFKADLFNKAKKILGDVFIDNDEQFISALDTMYLDDKIVIEENKIFLYYIHNAINNIINNIGYLHNQRKIKYDENLLEKRLAKIEEDYGIKYEEKQKIAIKTALNSKFTIINGGPGTGKTTIIKAIVKLFSEIEEIDLNTISELNKEIGLLAPTGRAAKKMEWS